MSRGYLPALFAVLAAVAPPAWGRAALCPGCNVILVTIDVLRGDETTAGGSPKVIMPNLEALAAKGVAFGNAFSSSAGTTPADLSILSGLYQWHHGVNVPLRDKPKKDEWAKSGRTLPSLLRNRGYEVYLEELGDTDDLNRLLENELAVEGKATRPEDIKSGGKFFLLLRAAVHDPYYPDYADVRALDPGMPESGYPTKEDVLHCAVASLLAKRVPPSLRFPREGTDFTFLPDKEQHAVDAIVDSNDPAARLGIARGWDPRAATYTLNSQCFWSFFSSGTIKTARLLYDASARHIDGMLGDFLQKLAAKGLLDKTLIVVTSQHGEAFLEHGYINHSSQLNGEIVHVPLLLFGPSLKRGLVVKDVVRSVDIMPTVLDILGEPGPADLDGNSLLPCLSGRCPKSAALSYYGLNYAVRDERYTYLRTQQPQGDDQNSREELYDRSVDPLEQRDIAQGRPEIKARLKAILDDSVKASDLERLRSGSWPDSVDENMREQIIRTGYW